VADESWADAADRLRQADVMTGQILKGGKPANTARAFGVRLSNSIPLLADEVIK
jgi:hypothetical protein